MTWDEFKKLIDDRLRELGRDGAEKIWYIDVSFPDRDRIVVDVGDPLGLSVG